MEHAPPRANRIRARAGPAAVQGRDVRHSSPRRLGVSGILRFFGCPPAQSAPEVGLAVENIRLQAVALDLGTTMVGAFTDDQVKKVVGMAEDERPLAIVPVGKGAQ